MSLSSELEKLISLRERGELTPAEFETAKKRLLAGGEVVAPPPIPETAPDELTDKRKKRGIQLLTAILASVAAALSAGSVLINPSPLKLIILLIWVVAATFGWIGYAKLKGEVEKLETGR